MAGGPVTTVHPVDDRGRADVARDRHGPGPARHRRLPHAGRRHRAQRPALAGALRPAGPRPVLGAAPHRVPRPTGPGPHQEGVPQDRASPRRTCAAAGSSAGARRPCSSSTAAGSSATTSASSTRTTRAWTPSRTSSACTTSTTSPSSRSPTSSSAACSTRCPSHATLVVTADHGQVHVGDNWIPLHPLREMFKFCRGGGPLPVPLREQGCGGRAARSRARRVRRPGVGVLPRPAPRRGLARPGPGHRVDPAAGRRRDPGAPRARRLRGPGPAERGQPRRRPRLAHRRRDVRPPPRRPRPGDRADGLPEDDRPAWIGSGRVGAPRLP